MSFYRTFIAAVAAMGLATAVLADEATTTTAPAATTKSTTIPATTTIAENNTASTDAAAGDTTRVDINKATAKDLAKVKGMSANKAKSIVSYRKKHGDFKSLDELKEVKGFKKMDEKTLKDIQDQLTVG